MCQTSDGGGAVIMMSSERAKSHSKKTPVQLLGVGEVCAGQHIIYADSLSESESLRIAASKAYDMAGVRPQDIDVAFPYDPATIAVIMGLEEMGFCKKGEGGAFVENGRIELGGELPVNTHGGLHSYRHYGMTLSSTVEAVRQLRKECGNRQVEGAEVALVHHEGGHLCAANTVMILGRE
jgi:acetyl-CoA acetyltransferase